MTYATDAKFVIGKLYEFTGSTPEWPSNAQKGSIWRFVIDDGTSAPKFEYVSGQCDDEYAVGNTTFLHVSQLKEIKEPKTVCDYTLSADEKGTSIFIPSRLTLDQLHKVIAIIEGVK
jgi:hypothetical protein